MTEPAERMFAPAHCPEHWFTCERCGQDHEREAAAQAEARAIARGVKATLKVLRRSGCAIPDLSDTFVAQVALETEADR